MIQISVKNNDTVASVARDVLFRGNGKKSTHKLKPSLRIFCQTMQERGDPELAFTTKMVLDLHGIVENSAK